MPQARETVRSAANRLRCCTVCAGVTALLLSATASAQQGGGAVPGGKSGAVVTNPAPAQPSQPNAVTPPQLTKFVPAPYPPEAQKDGVEGTVVLQLDIDAEGKVTSAVVVNPAGHGFDERAVEAAKQFVFAPALRAGKPVASRILYRYVFTLEVAKPKDTGTGPAAPPPVTRNLAGKLRTSEGEVPISGATVILRDVNGTEKSATTGEDGSWSFENLPPGSYKVTIKAAGYQKLEVQEQVVQGEATEVVYRLTPEGEIQVVVRGKRPPREVTKRTIEKREIERIPGTNGDALRSLQNLPGVARPPAMAGMLIVRGSAPEDTAVYIDGTLVPIVYHFGGLSSVVPTEFLERIDFYPGNFSSQFGRVTGGIVDVGLRSPKTDGRYHGMGQIDLIDARALLEGPVPWTGNKWQFMAGVRRSWMDTWLKPVLTSAGASVTAAPVYYDYQLLAETRPTPRSQLRISFIGSDDRLEILSKDTAEVDPILGGNIRLGTAFYRGAVRYRNDFTDNISLNTVTAFGKDALDFGVGSLYFVLSSFPISNRTELSTKLGRGLTMHTGIDIEWARAEVNIRSPQPPRAGEPDPGPFAARPPLTLSTTATSYRPGAYLEFELTPYKRVKIVPGMRVDYSKENQSWDVSPRMNARYTLVEEFPRTVLKGGMGLFHAPPQPSEIFRPYGNPDIHSNRSVHYSLGAEQDLARQVEVSVEGFYKALDQLVERSADASGGYSYNNLGRGKVIGAEVLLKYKPDARFFGWIAYTLSRSTRLDAPGESWRLFEYDQTHILTVLGSYRLGRGWEFGARFRLVSGNLDTPIIGALYDANAGAYASVTSSKPFTNRVPPFNQLDLRVDKRWEFNAWKLSTYLDVQNVYYSQNVEGYGYNYNYTQKSRVTGLPIIPSIGVRGEF